MTAALRKTDQNEPAHDADNKAIARANRSNQIRILSTACGAWLAEKKILDLLIESGIEFVRGRLAGPVPAEHPMRPHDAALAILPAYDITLADDAEVNAGYYLALFASIENSLVRANGMIRFAPFKLNQSVTVRSLLVYLVFQLQNRKARCRGELFVVPNLPR